MPTTQRFKVVKFFGASLLLFFFSVTANVAHAQCANLTPYQPPTWDNKLVVSTVTGTTVSASIFASNQIIYIDWAAVNNGTCNITGNFTTKLYLDAVLQNSWTTGGLNNNFYTFLNDVTMGPLAAGSHTIQIVVDADASVSETNETDNSFSRTITVTNCANLTSYQPPGWDNKLVLSTIAGTNTSASAFNDNEIIFIDWAAVNNGTCNVSATFYTKIFVDGLLRYTYNTAGINSNTYTYLTDVTIPPLSFGPHTIQIVFDANGNVAESNEADNSYSRIINVFPSVCISAPVVTVFNGERPIYTDHFEANNYRLKDICQAATIRVRDWNSVTDDPNPLEITSTNNVWTTQNQRFGGSVLWATRQAYNYFFNVHLRTSYNNMNGAIDGYVNALFNGNPNNASMSFTGGIMKVGLGGSGILSNCWGSLDIIGHEYTHAVTGASAGLYYINESGALNESFSDIFGECIENYILGANDWFIGGDRSAGAIRSMSYPKFYEQPTTYLSTGPGGYWQTGTYDNGGVHTNSGVQNYWFYLLANGGSGTNDYGYNYSITGIGIDKARAIAFRNLTVILNNEPNSDYTDAQMGSIQAAEDLYGVGSVEAITVKNAWCAVGLGTCCTTPAIVTVSGGGTFCNSTTLTASGGSGGTIYFQGTTNNGTSTTTLSSSQIISSAGTYYFRSYSCGTWGPQGSATVTINPSTNSWTGATSTAWENPANWSCGAIPNSTTDVIINSGTVVVNSNAACRTLSLMPGVNFTVTPGFNFNVLH